MTSEPHDAMYRPRQAARKALSISLQYPGLKVAGYSLVNTYRDSTVIRDLLTEVLGYKKDDIITMLDNDKPGSLLYPSRRNIIEVMKHLSAGAKSGDQIVFHFSGWGGRPHLKKAETSDDIDEVIWPADVNYDKDKDEATNYITSAEIHEFLLKDLPAGVNCLFIFDCPCTGKITSLPYWNGGAAPDKWPKRSTSAIVMAWVSGIDIPLAQAQHYGSLFTAILNALLRENAQWTYPQLLSRIQQELEQLISRANTRRRPSSRLQVPKPQLWTSQNYAALSEAKVKPN